MAHIKTNIHLDHNGTDRLRVEAATVSVEPDRFRITAAIHINGSYVNGIEIYLPLEQARDVANAFTKLAALVLEQEAFILHSEVSP